jgi:hypothetical protein
MGEITFSQILVIILGLVAIIKYVLDTYKGINKPNVQQDSRIQKLEDGCAYQKGSIDKYIANLQAELKIIKENHLGHIEKNISDLNVRMAKFETILDERLPKKNEERR